MHVSATPTDSSQVFGLQALDSLLDDVAPPADPRAPNATCQPAGAAAAELQIAYEHRLDSGCRHIFHANIAYTTDALSTSRALAIQGTGGNLFSDRETRVEYQPVGSIEREVIEVEKNDTVHEEFAEFMRCCREGTVPETDGEVGLAAIAVMRAMLESSRHDGRVEKVAVG